MRPAKTGWALTAAPGNEQGSPEETLNEPKAIIHCVLVTSSSWSSFLPNHRLHAQAQRNGLFLLFYGT